MMPRSPLHPPTPAESHARAVDQIMRDVYLRRRQQNKKYEELMRNAWWRTRTSLSPEDQEGTRG
jgi:hypothetical protein